MKRKYIIEGSKYYLETYEEECKTIFPVSEKEDDDNFWTDMYLEQFEKDNLKTKGGDN